MSEQQAVYVVQQCYEYTKYSKLTRAVSQPLVFTFASTLRLVRGDNISLRDDILRYTSCDAVSYHMTPDGSDEGFFF